MRKAPLLCAAIAGIAGIVFVDRGDLLAILLASVGLALPAFFLRRLSRPLAVLFVFCSLALLLLGWRHHLRLAEIRAFPLALALSEGKPIAIEGEGWIADTVDHGARSVTTTLQLDRIVLGGRTLPCDHRLPCWILKLPGELGYGTRVRFTGRLLPLEGPAVPGGFDARSFYFRRSGSLAQLEISDGNDLAILPGRSGSALVRFAFGLRGRLEEALLLGVPKSQEPYARLVAAMALGAREHSPEDLESYFRISGTMHLFAVSGLNVAIVAGMLTWIAAVLGIPKPWAVLAIIPLVLFYAVVTGLAPSAVRAALMASAFLAGYALREKPRLLNSLGFAALVLLGFDPQQIFLPGFQLSFAVLLFIALFTPVLTKHFARPFLADPFLPQSLIRPARRLADRLAGSVAALFAVSIASWLGSLGLLAWHFQSISPVGIIANVFMVPVAGGIMWISAISLSGYGLHLLGITALANRLNVFLSMALTAMAQYFASVPGATVHTGHEGSIEAKEEILRLDLVGDRGDGAALLEIPGKGTRRLRWMVDSGGRRTYEGRVLPLMRSRGLNRIDALVLTHGDEGHIGAAASAIDQFRPSLLLEGILENRSPSHRDIVETAARLEVKRMTMDRGDRLAVGEGAVLTILHPSSLRPGRLADDRALVLKLDYAGRSLLLTSDSGFDTEKALLDSGADLRADVWIRGQHSDAPSGLPAFVEAIRPLAVISTHSDFPESERISESFRDSLRTRNIPLFDLERSGLVTIEVSAETLRILPFALPDEALSLPRPEETRE